MICPGREYSRVQSWMSRCSDALIYKTAMKMEGKNVLNDNETNRTRRRSFSFYGRSEMYFEHLNTVHGPPTRKNYGARDPALALIALHLQMSTILISVDFKPFSVADVGGKVTQVHNILCRKSYNHQLRIKISWKVSKSAALEFKSRLHSEDGESVQNLASMSWKSYGSLYTS
jgi:hypothetical protein